MDHGEGFTAFNEKTFGTGQADIVESDHVSETAEPRKAHISPEQAV